MRGATVQRTSVVLLIGVLLSPAAVGCGSLTGEVPDGQRAVRCGVADDPIDTRTLIGLREREAVELARRHGCSVRVEIRDGVDQALGRDPPDRSLALPKSIGVTIRRGYVDRLCVAADKDGRCKPSLG